MNCFLLRTTWSKNWCYYAIYFEKCVEEISCSFFSITFYWISFSSVLCLLALTWKALNNLYSITYLFEHIGISIIGPFGQQISKKYLNVYFVPSVYIIYVPNCQIWIQLQFQYSLYKHYHYDNSINTIYQKHENA